MLPSLLYIIHSQYIYTVYNRYCLYTYTSIKEDGSYIESDTKWREKNTVTKDEIELESHTT